MNKQEIIYQKKLECAPLFSSKCYVCKKKFGRGFVFHHKYYYDNGAVYSDADYQDRIYDEIKEHPERFLLLCVKDHFMLEKLKRLNFKRFNMLVKAVRMSR